MAYRIRTISELTGIPKNTLIAWERRYGVVQPQRLENGYRSYTEKDLQRLLRIKGALQTGLSISEAVELLKNEQPLPPFQRVPAPLPHPENGDGYAVLREQLIQAFIHYQGQEARRILSKLLPLSFEERLHQIFFPVLREIGELWASGAINVAQEHYASAIIRDQLVSILLGVGTQNTRMPHAACATFPEEQHEIAAIALGVHLALNGYRVSYLGANLPLADLLEFVSQQQPSLICISAIMAPAREQVLHYARTLREHSPPHTRLILGGRGMQQDPPFAYPGVEFTPEWSDLRF